MARLIFALGDFEINHRHGIGVSVGGSNQSSGLTDDHTAKLSFGMEAQQFYGLNKLGDVAMFQPTKPSDSAWLERWIERHCVRDVIVMAAPRKIEQYAILRTEPVYLYFLDGWHRKEEFDAAYLDQSRANHAPLVAQTTNRDKAREIVAWVELNLKPGHQVMTTTDEVCVFPVDDEDAVHFKLRWMDHQPA